MINFIDFNGTDLFTDEYGEYRYVNAKFIRVDTTDERTNSKGTKFFRGSVQIPGDVTPTRTVIVFKEMLKDIKEGDNGLVRLRASMDGATLKLSAQFSYGEGGSQNILTADVATKVFGFSAPKSATSPSQGGALFTEAQIAAMTPEQKVTSGISA
jgi:hypothetical protein